jgi:peptidoglycan/xylan/chitin deacetylase (PgdA/CDA1 family)
MYHRFNEPTHPSTNISIEKFENQMNLLSVENFTVLPLSDLMLFFQKKKILPNKTIFITIDDAYKSVFTEAYPVLKKYGFPFSVFISTDFISKNENSNFMTWKMIEDLSNNNVEILNHTSSHKNLLDLSYNEIKETIIDAENLIKKKIGKRPAILSYPFGETSKNIEDVVSELKYKLAFSQHSSPIHLKENTLRLPRFAINEEYGSLDRFKLIINSKPLIPKDISLLDSISTINSPTIEFRSNKPTIETNCFINNNANLEKHNVQPDKIIINLSKLVEKQRYRLNCTYVSDKKELFWFGKMIIHRK